LSVPVEVAVCDEVKLEVVHVVKMSSNPEVAPPVTQKARMDAAAPPVHEKVIVSPLGSDELLVTR
jgi:hypothetical protein